MSNYTSVKLESSVAFEQLMVAGMYPEGFGSDWSVILGSMLGLLGGKAKKRDRMCVVLHSNRVARVESATRFNWTSPESGSGCFTFLLVAMYSNSHHVIPMPNSFL